MRNTMSILFAIGNIFLAPFVWFKLYGYFSPEVGFNLPELTYWNLFALFMVLRVPFISVGVVNSISKVEERLDILLNFNPNYEGGTTYGQPDSVVATFVYLLMWLFGYILYSILF